MTDALSFQAINDTALVGSVKDAVFKHFIDFGLNGSGIRNGLSSLVLEVFQHLVSGDNLAFQFEQLGRDVAFAVDAPATIIANLDLPRRVGHVQFVDRLDEWFGGAIYAQIAWSLWRTVTTALPHTLSVSQDVTASV